MRRFGLLARSAAFALALLAVGAAPVLAAGQIKPDAACTDEAKYKSTAGDTKAKLHVINNSDETVKVFWLNYDGKRVFYQDLKPHTSYIQATWITHPWVISSQQGDCYRFLVMNAVEQTVTVSPEVPDPEATVVPVSAAPAPSSSTAASRPAASGPAVSVSTAPVSGPTTPATSSDFLPLLIVGVLGSLIILLGGAAALGKLPGFGRKPRP